MFGLKLIWEENWVKVNTERGGSSVATSFDVNLQLLLTVHYVEDLSAHVLLNLLNELVESDKRRGLSSFWSLFRNQFNKFNSTGARMWDSI